jgi:hypothetical protein
MSIKGLVDFSVDVKGEVTGQSFVGTFSAKTKLSVREQLKQDELYRSILGVDCQNASEDSKKMAHALSYLATRITTAPDWWKQMANGMEVEDVNLIAAVNNSCIAAVEKEYEVLRASASQAEGALKAFAASTQG